MLRSKIKKTSKKKQSVLIRKSAAHHSGKEQSDDAFDSWRLLYVFLWLCFFSILFYALLFSSLLRVESRNIDGLEVVPKKDVEEYVHENLSQKYFYIIPRDNFIVFSISNSLSNGLAQQFKAIRSVDIARSFPNAISIHIHERETIAQWCSSGLCVYIDENGVAYAESNDLYVIPQKALLRVIDASNVSIRIGDQFLDEKYVAFLRDVQSRLKQTVGIDILQEATTPSRLSSEITLKTSDGWDIMMNTSLPVEQSVKMLDLLLKKSITSAERKELQYIDLRTENRVYYQLKGQTDGANPVDASSEVTKAAEESKIPTEAEVKAAETEKLPKKEDKKKKKNENRN